MTRNEAFKIFGLATTADEDNIKKKYKELVKLQHPDVNPDNKERAEEEFKKIQEAYDIITGKSQGTEQIHNPFRNNPFYDQFHNPFGDFGANFGQNFDFNEMTRRNKEKIINALKRPIPAQNRAIEINVSIDDILTKTETFIDVDVFNNCSKCGGIKFFVDLLKECPVCHGTGMHTVRQGFFQMTQNCNACGSAGVVFEQCNACDKNGFIQNKENIKIDFFDDNGLKTNHTIYGYGFPAKNAGNERGSLNVRLKIEPNDQLKIESYYGRLYLTNRVPIDIVFSDIIKNKKIKVPVWDYNKKKIVVKKIRLPKSVNLEHQLFNYRFLTEGHGLLYDDEQDGFLVNTRIDSWVK